MAKILLVDDDSDMTEVITHTLQIKGFTVQSAQGGREALELLRVNSYDVIILDWMMPGVSGVDVCERLRSAGNKTPILMLTCRTSADDKETGLDAGADDYLTKPFENKELAARIRALLRRPPDFVGTVLTAGHLALDPVTRKLSRDGLEIHARPMVINLLEFFMRHPNQFFSAEALLQRVWHDDSLASLDTVRSHIKLLRRSVDLPDRKSVIKTERNKGYRLDLEQAMQAAEGQSAEGPAGLALST